MKKKYLNSKKGGVYFINDGSTRKEELISRICRSPWKLVTNHSTYSTIATVSLDEESVDRILTHRNVGSLQEAPLERVDKFNGDFLIKICLLKDNEMKYTNFRDENKYSTRFESFQNEVRLQNEIYYLGSSTSTAYVPAIFEAIRVLPSDNEVILHQLENELKLRDLAQSTRHILGRDGNSRIGLIIMEFAKGYKELFDYQGDPSEQEAYSLAYHVLHRLNRNGYAHGDSHESNILISFNNNMYRTQQGRPVLQGSALIIDFGKVRQIEKRDQLRVSQAFTPDIEKKYIVNQPNHPVYQWLFDYWREPSVQQRVAELNTLEEEQRHEPVSRQDLEMRYPFLQVFDGTVKDTLSIVS